MRRWALDSSRTPRQKIPRAHRAVLVVGGGVPRCRYTPQSGNRILVRFSGGDAEDRNRGAREVGGKRWKS